MLKNKNTHSLAANLNKQLISFNEQRNYGHPLRFVTCCKTIVVGLILFSPVFLARSFDSEIKLDKELH